MCPRVNRGGGETVSPRHNARCKGAEGSVESVATRAGEAAEGQKASSIVIFILGREGGFGTLCRFLGPYIVYITV